MTDNTKDNLKVEINDGRLVISIGISTLCIAAIQGHYFTDIVSGAAGDEPTITDESAFAAAICHELSFEDEDGTTLVHTMLDKAAENAVEQGAEGIEFDA